MAQKRVVHIGSSNRLWIIFIIIILLCSSLIGVVINDTILFRVSGSSTWTQTSKQDFENGTLNNTTIEDTGANAKLSLDQTQLNHWTKKTPTPNPGSRWGHGMAYIYGTDEAILYGGSYSLFDTLSYNISTDTWVDRKPKTNPGAKVSHSMASFYNTDKILIFGDYYRTDHTWMYDYSDNNWTRLFPSTSPLGRRGSALSTVWGDDKVVLFGGEGYNYNDYTWIYDQSYGDWTRKTTSNYPARRKEHAMAPIWDTDKILLYGGVGWSSYPYFGDTWIFDISENNWTEMSPVNNPGSKNGHSLVPIKGTKQIVLFGGRPTGTSMGSDETWVYDFTENNWTKIQSWNTSNIPGARVDHTMAFIDGTDKAVMFGGYGSGTDTNTWIYKHHLKIINGTFTSQPFDTGDNSTFTKLTWNANVPVDTHLRFQLRTASSNKGLAAQTFVGPDGTTSTYYKISPANIWSGHYGDRWVQYLALFNLDKYTNSPKLDDFTVHYNCLPTTTVLSPCNGSCLSYNKPLFMWIFSDYDSENQNAFQVIIDDDPSFSSIDFDSGVQHNPQQHWEFPSGTNYTELPDGTWYWCVRTLDMGELWTDYSTPLKLIVDTQMPSSAPVIPVHNGYYNNVPMISGVASDANPGSGINRVELAIKRINDNHHWNGTDWVQMLTWVLATGSVAWTYDSRSITWTSGIMYSVQSRAVDNASNIEVPSINNIFTIDMDPPESYVTNPKNNEWLNKLHQISGIAIDSSGSDVDNVEVSIKCASDYISWDTGPKNNQYWDGTTWTHKEVWLSVEGTNEWDFNTSNVNWATGDHYQIRSRSFDLPGNAEHPSPGVTFMYDSKPPDKLEIVINKDEDFTSTTKVQLTLYAEDLGSGVADMAFSNDGMLWSDWEDFNLNRSMDLSIDDGLKNIYYRVRDHVGNIAEPVNDTIYLDTTPPQDLKIEILEDGKYTRSREITFNLMATDHGSGLGDMALSYDEFDWQPWEPFVGTKMIIFGENERDGMKKIYFKVRDKIGNTADPVFDSIVLDTAPPFLLSISINEGAVETNSTAVTLELYARDNLSGVSELSLSFDGNTWTDWEDYVTFKSLVLSPGSGKKTVYFKVKDKVGNEAGFVKTSILLNLTTDNGEPSKIESTPKESVYSGLIFFLILIIVVIILISIAIFMIIRRKKRAHEALLDADAVTVKPSPLPSHIVSVDQVPPMPTLAQLPTPSTASESNAQQVPKPIVPAPSPAPQLPSATVTPTQVPSPTVAPQPVPQLPPAIVEGSMPPRPSITPTPAPTPTLASTPPPTPAVKPTPTLVTVTPTPTQPTPTVVKPDQPTLASQSVILPGPTHGTDEASDTTSTPSVAVAQQPSNGPEVHLPDTSPDKKRDSD